MNIIYILFAIIMFMIIVCSGLFLFFTRIGKNLLTQIVFNKKYVVCHLKRDATDHEEIYRVVSKPDYLTTVGKYDYDLNPMYAIMRWDGRLHFILHENDVVPKYLTRKDSKEEVLIQVTEVKTALHNVAYSFLYKKNANLAMIIAGIALFISICIAIYGIYEIQKIAPLVQWLYDHPPATTAVTVPVK